MDAAVIVDAKAAARKTAFAVRRAAFDAGQGRAADYLVDYLSAHFGAVVAGYMAMRTEIDPLAAFMLHDGPVGMPVVEGAGRPLRFRSWTSASETVVGAFGASVPAAGDWLDPTVLIVPLLAFDARGYRLGYGGGFYDRTLEGLRCRGPILAVGFAFSAQEVAEVPIDATDQPLDAIVTERGVMQIRS